MMRIIGLTGGIGSGKSTVSNYLKNKGYLIIDADEISRDLTKKDGEAIPKIKEAFGSEVFFEDGSLNRKKLASIVFSDEEKLHLLETFTTNVVDVKIRQQLNKLREENYDDIVILDIPLLFEGGDQELCDETWLVTCDLNVKLERLMKRDNASKEDLLKRMNNQMSDNDKKILATYIIDNSYSLNYLYNQIESLLIKNNCN